MTVIVHSRYKLVAVTSLLALTLLVGLLAQHPIPEPSAVLQALRENDEAFLQRYSLTLRVDQTTRFPDWNREVYRLRGTSDQSRSLTAIILDQKEILKYPSYSVLRAQDERFGDNYLVPFVGFNPAASFCNAGKIFYLQEGRLYLEAVWLQTHWIGPDEQLVSATPLGDVPTIEIERYPSSFAVDRFEIGVQALGRGYSRELGQAISVSALPGGLLELKASDKRSPTVMWRLIIDPSRQYLVVEAEKIRNDAVVVRYKSEGTMDFAIPLAKRGTQIYYVDNGDQWVYRYECECYEPRFCEDWYDQVKQVFRRPPKGSSVVDFRTEPFTNFTVK